MLTNSQKVDIRKIDFKSVFNDYFPSLCVFAHKLVKDQNIAKDIVHDVFLKIWNAQTVFESHKSMKVYFYLATKNHCFDYIKRKQKEHNTNTFTESPLDDNTVVNEIIREETYRILDNAIDCLPNQSQRVIRLTLNGLSNKEIAEELQVSINTIKTHKLNAFKKLRDLMGHQYITWLLIEFFHFLDK